MNIIKKGIYSVFHDRNKLKVAILYRLARFYKSDKKYLKKLFKLKMGKDLNLENPQTFSEKLQWLKIYNRKPEYTKMVDKYAVKEYVANIIGEQYIIPTIDVWDKVEDINFDALPNQFVLKTTNGGGGGGVVVCKDKSQLDINDCKRKLRHSMKQNIYWRMREWPYKDVKPRIIAEQYTVDTNGELNDYKFYCFDGVPKVMFVATDRQSATGVCFDYFDMEFNHLPFEQGGPNTTKVLQKPKHMDKMIDIAKMLSKDISHVRVDLYNVDGKIYFGEMTFFDCSGMAKFEPEQWDYIFGSWIKLPE